MGDFDARLRLLFQQAGSPSLRLVASRIPGMTVQKVSDWRRGGHLPRTFESFEPLAVWLTARALRSAEVKRTDVLTLAGWRALWLAAGTADGSGERPVAAAVDPYRGLAPLRAADADLFFGRDDLIAELLALIDDAASQSPGGRIVIVTGASGAGKSSLLGAGLARGLQGADEATGPVRLCHSDLIAQAPSLAPGTTVVVDQFESLLASAQRQQAVRAVRTLAEDGVVVLGVRADFFELCAEHPVLAQAWQSHCLIVGMPSDDSLREVIAGPARLVGGPIEPGFIDAVVAEVQRQAAYGPTPLPLLAHALPATWQHGRPGLTFADYHAVGGIGGALVETAEAAWQEIEDRGLTLPARRLLLSLVSVPPSGPVIRRSVTWDAVVHGSQASSAPELEILVASRLVSAGSDGIVLMHDVLLTAWPRLAQWIDDDRESLHRRHQLNADAAVWEIEGRPASHLYRGDRLATVLRDRKKDGVLDRADESGPAREFLATAVIRSRLRRAFQIAAVLVVVALTVSSVVGAALSVQSAAVAKAERDQARYTQLSAAIDRTGRTDPSTAARLVLAAHRIRPTDPDVIGRLETLASQPLATNLHGHTGQVFNVAFDSTGTRLASAGNDRTVRIRTAVNGIFTDAAVLTGFDGFVSSVAFAPGRALLAAASGDGTIKLWDADDPRSPRLVTELKPGHGPMYALAFAPDGRRFAVGCEDGTIAVYDVDDAGRAVPGGQLTGTPGAVRAVGFDHSGTMLASGGNDHTVRLWQIGRPVPVATLTGYPSIVHAVAFAQDDRRLAVSGDAPTIELWDVTRPEAPQRQADLPGVTGRSWSVAFLPDGVHLAAAGADGTARIWSLSTPVPQVIEELRGVDPFSPEVFAVAPSPDGRYLATARSDGTVEVWRRPPFLEAAGGVSDLASSSDGGTLVAVGRDAVLRQWRTGGESPMPLSATAVTGIASDRARLSLSADGSLVAVSAPGVPMVRLVDLRDPAHPVVAGTLPTGMRFSPATVFVPGRRAIAVVDTDDSVAIWNVSDPMRPVRERTITVAGPGITALAVGPAITALAAGPAGTRLAAIADGRVTTIGVADGSAQEQTIATNSGTAALAFGDSDSRLIFAGFNGLSLVDRPERAKPGDLAALGASVSTVRFRDGMLAVARPDGAILRYRVDGPDAELVSRSPAQVPAIARHLAIGSSGRLYVSEEGSPVIRTMCANVTAAADLVRRNTSALTREQWSALVPDVPYQGG